LLKSGLFYQKGDSLVFQYWNMEDIIAEFIKRKLQTECAGWLLEHLDELDINCLLHKFYEAKFLSIVSSPNAIGKINEAIQLLYSNQAYKYTIPLSEIRWQYYEKNGESLLSYQYYVKYASYLGFWMRRLQGPFPKDICSPFVSPIIPNILCLIWNWRSCNIRSPRATMITKLVRKGFNIF